MSFSDSLESLRKIDINDLDVNNLGSWPAPIGFLTCIILGGGARFGLLPPSG